MTGVCVYYYVHLLLRSMALCILESKHLRGGGGGEVTKFQIPIIEIHETQNMLEQSFSTINAIACL